MFSEYDVVRLRSASHNAPGIPSGTSGTVLLIHPATPPAYEVEFVDIAGESLGWFTMQESGLELEWKAPPPDEKS